MGPGLQRQVGCQVSLIGGCPSQPTRSGPGKAARVSSALLSGENTRLCR